jgi:hypothetical protein
VIGPLVNLFRKPLVRCFSYETPGSLPTDEAETSSIPIKSSESTVSLKKIYPVYMRIIYIQLNSVVRTVLTAFTITAVRMPLVNVRPQSLLNKGDCHVIFYGYN